MFIVANVHHLVDTQMQHIYTMEYDSSMKRKNDVHATTDVYLGDSMLNDMWTLGGHLGAKL